MPEARQRGSSLCQQNSGRRARIPRSLKHGKRGRGVVRAVVHGYLGMRMGQATSSASAVPSRVMSARLALWTGTVADTGPSAVDMESRWSGAMDVPSVVLTWSRSQVATVTSSTWRARPALGDRLPRWQGRRPAAAVRWDSNPPPYCSSSRGRGREGAATWDSFVPIVTARARPYPQVTDAVRTQHGPAGPHPYQGSAPGPVPPGSHLPAAGTMYRWRPLGTARLRWIVDQTWTKPAMLGQRQCRHALWQVAQRARQS
jgi:hypothetical protein